MTDPNSDPPTQADLQALDAWMLRVLAWLVGVITRLGAPKRSRLLHRIIRLCERNAEAIVFELAEARAAPPLEARSHRPRSAPAGFRVKRIRGCRFFTHARVRLKREAGFAARVRRLLDVLAEPEACIERCLRLLDIGRKFTRLVAAAPPADPMRADAFTPAAFADSS